MKTVTVLGANGRVGSQVVRLLLDRGYIVQAFVHGDANFESHQNLTVVQGDIYNVDSVRGAVTGSDAVVSALGSWGTPGKDVLEVGMINVIGAMQQFGVNRIVTLTGSEARLQGDSLLVIHRIAHTLASLFAGKILRDGERHIALLSESGLQWTTLRSPVMNESGSTEFTLSQARPMPWQTIHRNAVATALVNMVDDKTYVSASPFINR